MKIVCVSGGSYKSFYLNHFAKLKQCDLLIFNFGIIYDYILKDELLDYGLVTKELMFLSSSLKAVVVAGINVVRQGTKTKGLIVCDGEKVYMSNLKYGVKIDIMGNENNRQVCHGRIKCSFVVGDKTTNYFKNHKIILSNEHIKPNIAHCSKNKIYIFCNKHGSLLVNNRTLKTNFYKVSVFKI